MMSGLDWTEELKKRTGIDFLTTRPMEIEKKSFEIIKGELGDHRRRDRTGKRGDLPGASDHHRYDDGGIRDQQDGGRKIRDRCALLYRG